MGGITKRWIAGLTIGGLVIAGGVGVTSMSVSGQTSFSQASGPVTAQYGTLTIKALSDTGATYELVANGVTTSETIPAIQPCATIAANSGTLLRVSPNPKSPTTLQDRVQIRNNGFGVNTGNTSCGSSSAAVMSGGELLKIELGSRFDNQGVSIASGSLNATRVKGGNLTVGFDGGDQVGAGLTTTWSSQTVPINAALITTTNDLFTSITVGSTSQKDNEGVSLAVGTTFQLVTLDPDFDIAVNCGEFVTVGSSGDVAKSATYQRLNNKTQPLCQDVGVRVRIEGSGSTGRVFWNNDTAGLVNGTTQNVQAYFTIVWAPTNDSSKLNRVIDYDGVEGTGSTSNPEGMLWCNGYTNEIPNLPVTTNLGGIDVNPNPAVTDRRAPWCLVDDARVLQADGKIAQTQKLFGSGDPWAR